MVSQSCAIPALGSGGWMQEVQEFEILPYIASLRLAWVSLKIELMIGFPLQVIKFSKIIVMIII